MRDTSLFLYFSVLLRNHVQKREPETGDEGSLKVLMIIAKVIFQGLIQRYQRKHISSIYLMFDFIFESSGFCGFLFFSCVPFHSGPNVDAVGVPYC